MEQTTESKIIQFHFQKEILSNPVIVNGKGVEFEPIGGGTGLIELNQGDPDQSKIITALDDFAKRGVAGVSKITAAEYAEKKSLPPALPLGKPREFMRAYQRSVPPKTKQEDTAVGAAPVASPPISLPSLPPSDTGVDPTAATPPIEKYPGFQPSTRRISRKPAPEKAASSLP